MEACDFCTAIDGTPVDVKPRADITLIGVAECNGTLALEHYRCNGCRAILSRRFAGESDERVWTVLDPAH